MKILVENEIDGAIVKGMLNLLDSWDELWDFFSINQEANGVFSEALDKSDSEILNKMDDDEKYEIAETKWQEILSKLLKADVSSL